MAWHPRLVVRRGKGGGITSSTSNLGYGFQGCLGVVFLVAILAAAFHGKPIMLLGAFIPGVLLRDVWAWFGATPQEREAFRQELAALALTGHGLPPDKQVIAKGSPLALVVALGVFAGALLLLKLTRNTFFLLLAMIAASAAGAVLLDVIRQRWGRRGGDNP